MKAIMENGVVFCYRSADNAGQYMYIDGEHREIEIEKNNDTIFIRFFGEKSKAIRLPQIYMKEAIIIIVRCNTPEKTVEVSYNGKNMHYEERKPTFEDNVLSNFVKEELIRGNIVKERIAD